MLLPLCRNAVQLLSQTGVPPFVGNFLANLLQGPGGYLQWLETDAWLFRAYPDTAEISEALTIVNAERQERDLVP